MVKATNGHDSLAVTMRTPFNLQMTIELVPEPLEILVFVAKKMTDNVVEAQISNMLIVLVIDQLFSFPALFDQNQCHI